MNLKKKMLLILLPIVVINLLSAQQSQTKKNNSKNALGIDLTRTYSGKEVDEIINIVLEECDTSITQSYNEGYKQAAIEFQSEVEYYKSLYKSNTSTGRKLKKILIYGGIGLGAGLLVGGITGFIIAYKIN